MGWISQRFEMRVAATRYVVFILVAALMSIAPSAFAGDSLHLKQGRVNTVLPLANAPWLTQALKDHATLSTRYYVVQFKEKILAEDRRNLETLGARILRYLPDDAFVVRATALQMQTIVKSSVRIRTTLPYISQWKLSPDFAVSSVFTADNSVNVLVRLFPGESAQDLQNQIQAINGVKVNFASGDVLVLNATFKQLADIAKFDGIEWIQEQPKMESFDAILDDPMPSSPEAAAGDYTDLTGYESGTKVMKFDAAYSRGFFGADQVVGMADTGLDRGDAVNIHADFKGRIKAGHAFGMFCVMTRTSAPSRVATAFLRKATVLWVSSVTSNTATSGHFKCSILIKPYSFVLARSFSL